MEKEKPIKQTSWVVLIFGSDGIGKGLCPGPMYILVVHGFLAMPHRNCAALVGNFVYGLLKKINYAIKWWFRKHEHQVIKNFTKAWSFYLDLLMGE